MTRDTHRSVDVERVETGVYLARNSRGGELRFGSTAGADFTPVEVLPRAVQVSRDRTCTVSRTIEAGTSIAVQIR